MPRLTNCSWRSGWLATFLLILESQPGPSNGSELHSRLMPPPSVIGEKRAGENDLDDLLARYTAISTDVARELDVPLCDLSTAFRAWLAVHNPGDAGSGLLTTDGVHLTDEGNRLLADTVAEALGVNRETPG